MRWSYVLRNRRRWSGDLKSIAMQAVDASETLSAFGLSDDSLREIANAGTVCVEMAYRDEATGWAARIMPWEYLLSAGTRRFRQPGAHLTVLRNLSVIGRPTPQRADAPEPRVLFVQSQPGLIAEAYNFQDELQLVHHSLGLRGNALDKGPERDQRWTVMVSPTLDELRDFVRKWKPEIVHIAGCDNHEGIRTIASRGGSHSFVWSQVFSSEGEVALGGPLKLVFASEILNTRDGGFDGVMLRAGDGLPRMTTPDELGWALTGGGAHQPLLVCINTSNSAARIAPLLLARGVLAAVGVQDALDDALAEYFFELLYSCFRQRWDLPQAFGEAFGMLRREEDLGQGSGVALWGAAPFLVPGMAKAAALEKASSRATASKPSDAHAGPGSPAPESPEAPPASSQVGASAPVADTANSATGTTSVPLVASLETAVTCRIKPKLELNYSELHNGGNLFEDFELRNSQVGQRQVVDIRVELHCGAEQAHFVCREEFDGPRLPLLERVRVPLTASLMRKVQEAMRSGLFVEVLQGDRVIVRNTFPLRLLPVDQWLDNATSGKWLPSFVLPRDPAIESAIAAAQRYVRVIRDDPTAGFEGYQEADPEDPGSLEQVDLQVEAIWAALLHEWQLSYINPPPTYGAETAPLDSQRLRTPSAVRRTRMGTCIDLALLFSACLELVDIYPVIFLLKGHALPGYWRHDRFQAAFNTNPDPGASEIPVQEEATRNVMPGVQRVAWRSDGYQEIRNHIRTGKLVPLETVRLTEHCGFREAMQAGLEALSEESDFECVLDIITARRPHNVTPLPILGDA